MALLQVLRELQCAEVHELSGEKFSDIDNRRDRRVVNHHDSRRNREECDRKALRRAGSVIAVELMAS